jgi:hypothetical protein
MDAKRSDGDGETVGAGLLRVLALATEDETLGARAAYLLRGAAEALGVSEVAALERVLEVMASSWASRRLGDPPAWSGLTRDRSPFELSANFDRQGVELRFALEPHGEASHPVSYWRAASSLADRLCAEHGARRDFFDRVADLYVPVTDAVYMAAAFATGVGRRGRPAFKIYLPLEASGVGRERALLASTFGRLHLAEAWERLDALVGPDAQWSLLALDLAGGAEPSFKAYERLMGFDPARLAGRVRHGVETKPELIARFCDAMEVGPDTSWSVLTYAFRGATCTRTTYHLPFSPHGDEASVRARVLSAFAALGIPSEPYRRLLARSLGLFHTYVSCQEVDGEPRLTTYLSPRFFQDRHGVCQVPAW